MDTSNLLSKIKIAISDISKSEGVNFSISEISEGISGINFKVSVIDSKIDNEDNLLLSKKYGFNQNIVGLEFRSKSGNFVISGFKVRNRKYQ